MQPFITKFFFGFKLYLSSIYLLLTDGWKKYPGTVAEGPSPLNQLLALMVRVAGKPVFFGRNPACVPAGSIILFPCVSGISCGLTCLVACGKADTTPRFDLQALEREFKDISSFAPSDSIDDLPGYAPAMLEGVSGFVERVQVLRRNSPFYEIYSDIKLKQRLQLLGDKIEKQAGLETEALSSLSTKIDSNTYNLLSTRIETLKDAAWCIRKELLENFQKIQRILGNLAQPGKNEVLAAKKINTVLNSIERLEVRGRDSAGISIFFFLDQDKFTAFEEKLQLKGLMAEFGKRSDFQILSNKAISVSKCGSEASGVQPQYCIAMTYKVAAEIGRLGENTDFLRFQISNDQIMAMLLSSGFATVSALAHTRWASVGQITEANCHPHDAPFEKDRGKEYNIIIHAVLNGDIDNYADLADEMKRTNMEIPPDIDCDAKVIPARIKWYLMQGCDFETAFRKSVSDFMGSHAIAVQTSLFPGTCFLALKGSGQALFIGLSPESYIPTSEVYGFVEETNRYVKMEGTYKNENGDVLNGQIFIVSGGGSCSVEDIKAINYSGEPIPLSADDVKQTPLTSRDIDRQDFDHYFLKEISESPESIRRTVENRFKLTKHGEKHFRITLGHETVPGDVLADIRKKTIKRIFFIGQGTAGVAALVCANIMRHYLNDPEIRIESAKASELSGFMLGPGAKSSMADTLVIPISQSGTTADTNRTVDMVKQLGARVIAIVNRRDSDLTFKADGVLYTSSGRDIEMSVASTKAFYSQIAAGAILALFFAQETNSRPASFIDKEIQVLSSIPAAMEQVLEQKEAFRTSAFRLAPARTYWAAVGSGPNKAAADEIRIKLSELCYKTISSDHIEDKKHIDLSSEPLIIVCASGTRPSVMGDIIKDTAIFKSHKALPVVMADEGDNRLLAYCEDLFHLPPLPEHFAPITNTLAGHLWGYYAALAIHEGSEFLDNFRRELMEMIGKLTSDGYEINEIILDRGFQEKIYRFYTRFRRRLAENRLPDVLGTKTSADLILLLKYLSGRLPVADFEIDFGKKGTAKNMVDTFFSVIGDAINRMARPIDAIKHQAKTVTVGTSRIEEKAEGIIFNALSEFGFNQDNLTIQNMMVIRNIQRIVGGIKGATLYGIEGLNFLGEPTENSTIRVLQKTGTSASIPSRAEKETVLKGTKKIIVQRGNVYIGKGRKDNRSILVIPLISSDPDTPHLCEHLLLLEITFAADIALNDKIRALGGKYDHIKNIVVESNVEWNDKLLELIPVPDLFGFSAEKIAERIIERSELTDRR